MKTVAILETFDGSPAGEKRRFVAGETPSLDDAYADLLIGKGLAAEFPEKAAALKGAKKEKLS